MSIARWQRAWVTGAGRGIGAALAEALARDGVIVYASARNREELDALAERCSTLAGSIVPMPLDITQKEDIEAALNGFDKEGWPELVVLNAGTYQPFSAHAFDEESFQRQIDVNVNGTMRCLAPILQRFTSQDHGHIAVMASVAGYRGLPTASAYGASKAALINMCESLRLDLRGTGVKLQLINPGFVRTPLTDKNTHDMPALLEPEDAADRIVRGLSGDGFEITFPKRFTYWLKFFRILPYRWYFALVGRATKSGRSS